jgi:hypothetical protein
MSSSYLKASFDGLNGSGKTGTVARLAVGIAIEYGNRAPVVVNDSEERWRFLKPTIFDVEKVPLVILPGKSLVDVRAGIASVEKRGACVWVDDQLTTPWMEGIREFSHPDGYLPFDRRQQLMNQWEPIVDRFRYGRFHALCCGRLGFQWSNVEDDQGRMQLVQGDSKFNAGGGNNFGYEADLEVEMKRKKVTRLLGKLIGKKTATSVQHVCQVVKDAASGILNGREFVFDSTQGLYKAGDYKPVLEAFRPYIDFMLKVEAPVQQSQSSRDLLVSGKTPWAANESEKKKLLEELDANLTMCFPTGEGKSKLAKMFRDLTLEYLNGFISWSRMEDECPVERLMRNVAIVKAVRLRIEAKDIPTDQASLQTLLDLSTEDVQGRSGKKITLFEAMGLRSVANVKRGQAVVAALDQKAGDELAV